MSRVRFTHILPRYRAMATTLSAAALLAGLGSLASIDANAQSLRGNITEEEAANNLLLPPNNKTGDAKAKKQKSPPPRYEPSTLGGLTSAEEAQRQTEGATPSVFEDPDGANRSDAGIFSDAPPIPPGRPSTAERRSPQNRSEPQTAAERRRAPGSEEVDDATTGTTRVTSIGSEERNELVIDQGAERAEAIETRDVQPEDQPFEAPGIRAGSFILRPSIEQGITATSNASSSPDGGSGVESETTIRLNAASDWQIHSATFDAYGKFRKPISGDETEQEFEGGFDARASYDLDRDYRLDGTLSYSAIPEGASSPVMLGAVKEDPLHHSIDGSLGLTKDLGKLRLGAKGKLQHDLYADAEMEGGGVIDQADRDSTLATATLRLGYEISPTVTPFVEIEGGRRFYDEKTDFAGYERSSDVLSTRAGLALDAGEKLKGEFSAGWLRESFDDDRLEEASGAVVSADLRWQPWRGTTVGLNGTTTVEGTTTPGSSGSLLYAGRLSVERQVRYNLTTNAELGVDWRHYDLGGDKDLLMYAQVGGTWWMNRYLGLTTRFKHERQTSDLPDRDYTANSAFLGLKLQR